jgi:hypothetical protein
MPKGEYKMIKTVSKYEFTKDLLCDDYANWSYSGASALFEYLTELEEDTGEQIEFDRVALRCDFSEYDNLEDILSQYDSIDTLEELEENTIVIEVKQTRLDTGYIIQNF